MSIQIIDGFQVNTALPIDNRIVASGSAARNAISFKYHGLRVFDISDSIPYVWNGSSWVSENASGILASGTTANYIPMLSANNVVVNSIIYATGSNIGVNTVSPSAISGETTTFHVNGGIRANKFQGDGSLISNIPGSNINNGSIPVSGAGSKLINGSTGQVLVSGFANPFWTNQNLLSVGTASSSLTSNITRVPTGSGTHSLTFIGSGAWSVGSGIGAGVGNEVIRASNIDLTYVPDSRTLSVGIVSVGSGVRFPSTQIPSTNANTLDDYEEGTTTNNLYIRNPGVSAPTVPPLTTDVLNYVKIGRHVTVSGRVMIGNPGLSYTARPMFIKLPFTAVGQSAATFRYSGLNANFNGYILQGYTTGYDDIQLVAYNPTTRAEYYDLSSWIGTGGIDIYFSMSYMAIA
jgi:hypothetical protein